MGSQLKRSSALVTRRSSLVGARRHSFLVGTRFSSALVANTAVEQKQYCPRRVLPTSGRVLKSTLVARRHSSTSSRVPQKGTDTTPFRPLLSLFGAKMQNRDR
jgi:hypothetical protein